MDQAKQGILTSALPRFSNCSISQLSLKPSQSQGFKRLLGAAKEFDVGAEYHF